MTPTPYQREIAQFYLWCIDWELLEGKEHEDTTRTTEAKDANQK